jgi:oligosaccharide reducing-end xylanase
MICAGARSRASLRHRGADSKDNKFWCSAADASRKLLRKAAHPVTGLSPDYCAFDGKAVSPFRSGHQDFRYDAWRVAMNVAMDWVWFGRDPWAVEQSDRILNFFHAQGLRTYGNQFTLEGKKLADDHSAGLVAMNAVAALAAAGGKRREFVEELWRTPISSGRYRYYDGLLHMLALLQLSGNFRIYDLAGGGVQDCPR